MQTAPRSPPCALLEGLTHTRAYCQQEKTVQIQFQSYFRYVAGPVLIMNVYTPTIALFASLFWVQTLG